MKTPTVATAHRFTDEERHGVYRAIYERRDVRSRFAAEPLPDDVLSRILDAAHHAPSVGFDGAEGVGVGWISILDVDAVRRILAIPPHVVVVGYLCLGYVSTFEPEPELALRGWEHRVPLAEALHFERYGGTDEVRAQALAQLSEAAGRRR
jgi:nitroreductase